MEVGFDFLEGLAEDGDGEENVQAYVRSECAVLRRDRNGTLRSLAMIAVSRLNRVFRDDFLREWDVFDETSDGSAPSENIPTVRTRMEGMMLSIRNIICIRHCTTEGSG